MERNPTDVTPYKEPGASGNPGSLQQPEESVIQPGIQLFTLPSPLVGTLTISTANLGAGRYSEVFLGTWTRNEEVMAVAIKRLRTVGSGLGFQERFNRRIRQEASIWQRTNHPNILPFIGYQILDEQPLLVSPWCQNGSLSQYLLKHSTLAEVEKLKLLRDAARGLAYLHSLQPSIVHGDIKPENILIRDDLTAAITDFGVSIVIESLGEHTGFTTSGFGPPTTGYQAAELFENSRPTTMSDVYALGGVILATMSGHPPFHHLRTTISVVMSIAMGNTPQPQNHPGLPADDRLWLLMRRCWDSRPVERPSMGEIVDELEAEIAQRSAGPGES